MKDAKQKLNLEWLENILERMGAEGALVFEDGLSFSFEDKRISIDVEQCDDYNDGFGYFRVNIERENDSDRG
jgi:hypothetical protein